MIFTFRLCFLVLALNTAELSLCNPTRPVVAIADLGIDPSLPALHGFLWTPEKESEVIADDKSEPRLTNHGYNIFDTTSTYFHNPFDSKLTSQLLRFYWIQGEGFWGDASIVDGAWYLFKLMSPTFRGHLGTFGRVIHGNHVATTFTQNLEPNKQVMILKIYPSTPPNLTEILGPASESLNPNSSLYNRVDYLMSAFHQLRSPNMKEFLQSLKKHQVDLVNLSVGENMSEYRWLVRKINELVSDEELTSEEVQNLAIRGLIRICDDFSLLMQSASNTLFIIGAGNSYEGSNNDLIPTCPANSTAENKIVVAAVDAENNLASFSHYGAKSVDIAAQGVAIYAYALGETKLAMTGTSMAAPMVTRVAYRILLENPELSPIEVKSVILDNVKKVSSLNGRLISGGVVDEEKAVNAVINQLLHQDIDHKF